MRLGSQVVDVRNEKFFNNFNMNVKVSVWKFNIVLFKNVRNEKFFHSFNMVEVSLWKFNINRSFQFAKEIKQILKGPAESIFKLK